MTPSIPLLDLVAQYRSIQADVDAAVARVLASQHFILGPEVEACEREIAAYSGCEHGVGVSSGTDAILVALMALGVGPGDEVVTTPYTFVATAMCVARLGATARFVDIEPRTYNIDPAALEAAIGPRTKVILPVHLYGQMAELGPILALASRRGLPVIEDGAQAIGAELDGRRCGALGAFGCMSFFPSKNLGGAGDGGMLVTNDAALAVTARLVRNQGQRPKYFSRAIGGNFRLDALQAAIVRAKLPHLDGWTRRRQEHAALYRERFRDAGFDVDALRPTDESPVALPQVGPARRHVYNQFVIRVRDRDGLRAHLTQHGIGHEIYYPQPMHLQEAFASWGGREGQFPEAEAAAKETLAIPIDPMLSGDALARVADVVVAYHRR